MKYISVAVFALFLGGCGEMTTRDVVNKVEDGTVLITNQIDTTNGGIGTGFMIADNLFVTNDHVIKGKNNKLFITTKGSAKKYEAELINTDVISDIAIIKVKDWEKFKADQKPVTVTLGDSDKMDEGDKVIVIGHPWGLDWTVSEGIVSAKNRRQGPNPKYLDQVDAKIYQGNSGGPVFNEKGEVVCVSEIMLSGEGGSYGFCVPSNLVKKIVYDMETFKEVRWRAINVSIGLTEDGSSVIINSVEPNGAADKAGIKENDKVIKVYTANDPIEGTLVERPDDLITTIARLKGDDQIVEILIDRNGQLFTVPVKTNYKLSSEYEPDKNK